VAPEAAFVEHVMDRLEPFGDVSTKAMFGGNGIWEAGDMFALITADSELHFKVDDATRPRYEEAGCTQFRSMPYWSVPGDVLEDDRRLAAWAEEAIEVGHATAARNR
jgi:DNA transformation protein